MPSNKKYLLNFCTGSCRVVTLGGPRGWATPCDANTSSSGSIVFEALSRRHNITTPHRRFAPPDINNPLSSGYHLHSRPKPQILGPPRRTACAPLMTLAASDWESTVVQPFPDESRNNCPTLTFPWCIGTSNVSKLFLKPEPVRAPGGLRTGTLSQPLWQPSLLRLVPPPLPPPRASSPPSPLTTLDLCKGDKRFLLPLSVFLLESVHGVLSCEKIS